MNNKNIVNSACPICYGITPLLKDLNDGYYVEIDG